MIQEGSWGKCAHESNLGIVFWTEGEHGKELCGSLGMPDVKELLLKGQVENVVYCC